MQGYDRTLETQLCEATLAGCNFAAIVQHADARQYFRRSKVYPQARTGANGPRRGWQNVKFDVDDLRRQQTTNRSERHSSFNFTHLDAGEIHRRSLTRLCS